MDPSGKVALITGGAGVLGQTFGRHLLKAGAQVVLCDVDGNAGNKVIADLDKEFGKGKAIFVKADVTISSDLEEVFKAAKSTFHRLDIVINNAGIMRDATWEKEIDINLKGVVHGILLSYKYMGRPSGGSGGVVVNMSSTAGLVAVPQMPIYAGTKHAVAALTRSYGDDLHVKQTGVWMVALCPGPTDTPMAHQAADSVLYPYCRQPMIDAIAAFGPMIKPEFIAEGLMRVIREGKSGSVWMVTREIKEVVYPRLLQ